MASSCAKWGWKTEKNPQKIKSTFSRIFLVKKTDINLPLFHHLKANSHG